MSSEETTVTTFDVATQSLQETAVPPASGRTEAPEGDTAYQPAQKPAAPSEGQREDTSRDDGGNQEQAPRGKNWASRKIDELTREREEARREKAELMGLLKQYAPAQQREEQQQRPQVPQEYANDPGYDPQDPEPNRDDFDSYTDYERKLMRWEARREHRGFERQREALQHRERVVQQVVQETRQIASHYNQSAQAWEQSHPDFNDKVESLSHIDAEANPVMTRAIFTSANPPALLDALSERPDIAHRITQLPADQQIRAIAYIESRLHSQPAQVSNAPRVGRPVGSSAVGTRQSYRDDFTPSQHRAWKKANGIG